MANFTRINDWMQWDYLDGGFGLDGAYTLAWKITDDPSERWSARFVRFKAKEAKALYAGRALLAGALPRLVDLLHISGRELTVIPALSSGETIASPSGPLASIAKSCAQQVGAAAVNDAVTKQVHSSIHSVSGGVQGRDAELAKANYQAERVPGRSVIIVDDFITRGATLSHIARALREAKPDLKVYGVALGKTENRSWMSTISNDDVPARWDALWVGAEKRFSERD